MAALCINAGFCLQFLADFSAIMPTIAYIMHYFTSTESYVVLLM